MPFESNNNLNIDQFNSRMQALSYFCSNQALIDFYSSAEHGYEQEKLTSLIDVFELFLYLSLIQNNDEVKTSVYVAIARILQEPDYLLIQDYYANNPLLPSNITPDLYSDYCIKSLDEAMETICEFGTHYYERHIRASAKKLDLASQDFDIVIQSIKINLEFYKFLESITFDEEEKYTLEGEAGILFFLKFVVLGAGFLSEVITQDTISSEQLVILKESIFVTVKECSKYLNSQISPDRQLIQYYTLLIGHVKTLINQEVLNRDEGLELVTVFAQTKAYQLEVELPLFQFFSDWIAGIKSQSDLLSSEQKSQLLNVQSCLQERNRQVEQRIQSPVKYDCSELSIEETPLISACSDAQKLDLIASYCTSNERISFFNSEQLDADLVKYNRYIYQYFLNYAKAIKNLRYENTAKIVLTLLGKYPSASSESLDNPEAALNLDSILFLCKQSIKKRLINAHESRDKNGLHLSILAEEIEASRIYLDFIEVLHQKTIGLVTIIIFLDRIIKTLDLFHRKNIDNKISLYMQKGVLFGLRAALTYFNQEQKPNEELLETIERLSHKCRHLTFSPTLDPGCIISILEGFMAIENDSYKRQRIRTSHCWDFSRLVYLASNAWDANNIKTFRRLHRRIELKELEFYIPEQLHGELTMNHFNQLVKTLVKYIRCADKQHYDEQLVENVMSNCKTLYRGLDAHQKNLFKKEVLQLNQGKVNKTGLQIRFVNFFQELFVSDLKSMPSKKKKVAQKQKRASDQNRRLKKITPIRTIAVIENTPALPEIVEPAVIKACETKETRVQVRLTLDSTEQTVPVLQIPRVTETITLDEVSRPSEKPIETAGPDFFQELAVKAKNLNHAFQMYRHAEQRMAILRQDLMYKNAVLSQPMTQIERRVHMDNSRYNSPHAQEIALRVLSHNVYDLYLQFESHYLGVNHWLYQQIQENLQPIEHAKNEIISAGWLVHYAERYRRQVLLKPKERHLLESIESNVTLLQDKPVLIVELLRIKAKYNMMFLEHLEVFLVSFARACLKNALDQDYKMVMDKVWKGFELPSILPFYHELHRYSLFFELFPGVLDLIKDSGSSEEACLANIETHLNSLSLIAPSERKRDLLFKKVFRESEPLQTNNRYTMFAPQPLRIVPVLGESGMMVPAPFKMT